MQTAFVAAPTARPFVATRPVGRRTISVVRGEGIGEKISKAADNVKDAVAGDSSNPRPLKQQAKDAAAGEEKVGDAYLSKERKDQKDAYRAKEQENQANPHP
ncbi:hypothetical protein D9Q98_002316 [Chlorella vulgaris]|uniref:Uncharacterized protein n=1 Tax=Chlorella vulgaris TaxID=3077 RepID=A0A9D4TW54_CHLVU|nr:hypothetical protein D9Q98_002316 [Chlorella vulgaris]